MNKLKSFKPGLWVKDGKYPFYILGINEVTKQYFRLFSDGSGSWRSDIALEDLFSLTNEKFFDPKRALKKAFKFGHLDNLSYVEYLARIKEDERTAKSKKSV